VVAHQVRKGAKAPFFMPVCLFFIVGGWVGGWAGGGPRAYLYITPKPEPEPEPEMLDSYDVI
jgi:hypothetical protein